MYPYSPITTRQVQLNYLLKSKTRFKYCGEVNVPPFLPMYLHWKVYPFICPLGTACLLTVYSSLPCRVDGRYFIDLLSTLPSSSILDWHTLHVQLLNILCCVYNLFICPVLCKTSQYILSNVQVPNIFCPVYKFLIYSVLCKTF